MADYNEGERSHKHAFEGDKVHDQHLKQEVTGKNHLKMAVENLEKNIQTRGRSETEMDRMEQPPPKVKEVQKYEVNGGRGKRK